MLGKWLLILEPYPAEWQMNSPLRLASRGMKPAAVSHCVHVQCACPWGKSFPVGPSFLMGKMSCNVPPFHNPSP